MRIERNHMGILNMASAKAPASAPTAAPAKESVPWPGKAGPADDLIPKTDTAEISEKARQKARDEINRQNEMQRQLDMMREQLENAKAQGEALAKEAEIRLKCLIIAMRILKGDKVPPGDYSFLAEHDLKMYSMAVSMRTENEHPVKHKRLSEDEEDDTAEGVRENAGSAAPNAEASAEVSTEETEGAAEA